MGTPAVLSSGTPSLAAAAASNVSVGVNGSPLEQGLEASRLALSKAASGPVRANSSITLI